MDMPADRASVGKAAALASSVPPAVTVIVPTYNAEEFIAQCLDSVLVQTMGDFELICVDDGSTDTTCAIVEERARRDERVVALRQENAGPGAARNVGLDRARGRYVYCLDADDYLERDMLARCVRALDDMQADMALVAFRTHNQQVGRTYPAEWSMRHEDAYPSHPNGSFTWETAPDLFFETVQNVPWNKMVRRALLEERGIRFQELRLTEDLMYSLPAAVAAKAVVRIPQPLVVHREFAGTNAMSDKGRHPLDFLDAFDALRAWLQETGVYGQLRLAYREWLLDAVYYNLPTYRDFDGFAAAYERLTAEGLGACDLASADVASIRDHRYRGLLEALRSGSRERFLLACANIEAAEVQEQKCGFQDAQGSLKWLWRRLRDRLRS